MSLFKKPPELISMGFAAYILFMRPVKKESGKYFGMLESQFYIINDDRAPEFFGLWDEGLADVIVSRVPFKFQFMGDRPDFARRIYKFSFQKIKRFYPVRNDV